MEKCDQKAQSLCAKSGFLLSGPDTYFLEMSAHISLKVATKRVF